MLQPGWVTSEDVTATAVTMVPDYLSHKYYYSDYSDKTFINGWVNLFCPNSFLLNVADARSQGKHGHLVNGPRMSTQTLGPLTLDLYSMMIFFTYLGINCMLAAKASGIPILPRAWALWRYEDTDTEMFCNNPDSGSITRRDSSSQPRVQRLLSFANFTSYQLLILCGLSLMPFWVITSGSVIYLFICLFQDSGVAGEGEKDKV